MRAVHELSSRTWQEVREKSPRAQTHDEMLPPPLRTSKRGTSEWKRTTELIWLLPCQSASRVINNQTNYIAFHVSFKLAITFASIASHHEPKCSNERGREGGKLMAFILMPRFACECLARDEFYGGK
jgi:hypothetical protein